MFSTRTQARGGGRGGRLLQELEGVGRVPPDEALPLLSGPVPGVCTQRDLGLVLCAWRGCVHMARTKRPARPRQPIIFSLSLSRPSQRPIPRALRGVPSDGCLRVALLRDR